MSDTLPGTFRPGTSGTSSQTTPGLTQVGVYNVLALLWKDTVDNPSGQLDSISIAPAFSMSTTSITPPPGNNAAYRASDAAALLTLFGANAKTSFLNATSDTMTIAQLDAAYKAVYDTYHNNGGGGTTTATLTITPVDQNNAVLQAAITIDGTNAGTGKISKSVAVGKHVIIATLTGYNAVTVTVTVPASGLNKTIAMSRGMSTGEKIAIGTGIGLTALAILVVASKRS